MAEGAEVVRATRDQAAWMRSQANTIEQAALAAFAGVIGRRLAYWKAFEGVLGSYDLNLTEIAGEDVIGRNNAANISSAGLLKVLKELYAGKAELVGIGSKQTERMHLGVAPRGSVPQPLEALPLLPLIVVGGAGIAWLSFDLWVYLKKAESEAQLAESANQARKLELLKLAQAQGPIAVNQMAKIIKTIDDSAADKQRGLIDQLKRLAQQTGKAVADAGEATKTAASWGGLGLVAVLLWWAMSTGKGR